MDSDKVFNLASTSLDSVASSPSLFDQITGVGIDYAKSLIAERQQANNVDAALGEQKVQAQTQIAIAGQNTKAIIIGAAVLLAAVVLYKVL